MMEVENNRQPPGRAEDCFMEDLGPSFIGGLTGNIPFAGRLKTDIMRW
jgi:hypothetical protein